MDKTNIKIIISFFIIGIVVLSVALFTDQSSDIVSQNERQVASVQLAQNPPTQQGSQTEEEINYQPISGIDTNQIRQAGGSEGDFIGVLRMIFNWGVAIVIALSILFTIIGAVQYMTTDAIQGKTEGKDKMQAAIGGLILALVSWLILFSINQNILSSNFLLQLRNSGSVNNQSSSATTGNNQSSSSQTGGSSSQSSGQQTITNREAESFFSTKNVVLANGASAEGMKASTANIVGSIGEEIGDEENPLVLSSGTESSTTANQNNPGGVFEFDTSDNPEKADEIDQYFLDLIGEESIDDTTRQLPRRATIDGKDVEVTPTFTGWTVEVIDERTEQLETNNGSNTGGDQTNQDNNNSNNNTNTETNNETGFDSNFQQDNNSDYITIDELLEISERNNQGDNNNQQNNNDTNQQISEEDLNELAFQDKAFDNVFIKNQSADITNMSDELESLILITRDYCCGRTTTINGEETYRSSFNISDIDTSNNSFFIERSVTDEFGANHWRPLNNNISSNLYPDQNLIDITEYIECRESRSRFTSWLCNRPDNFREIDGRYYSLTRKSIDPDDVLNGSTYRGETKGLSFEAVAGNNSWELKI